jgi:hypothetical protein
LTHGIKLTVINDKNGNGRDDDDDDDPMIEPGSPARRANPPL